MVSDILYLVIPCFNEEEVLPETCKRLTKKLKDMMEKQLVSGSSGIVFVDDGSRDHTWGLIEKLYEENALVLGIKSSRNRGHQNTLLAGLMTVRNDCDLTISMDADLQDDIEVLDQFVKKYEEGCEIVYGVRSARQTDTVFKRFTAESYYRMIRKLGADIVYNHADYRLMSSRALEELEKYKEVNLFLRGVIPLIGFQTGTVAYERQTRFAGVSKYPLKKMISFAVDGITSLSMKPIRIIALAGIALFLVSILMMLIYLVGYCTGKTVQGWATIVISIRGIGGLELLATGIIGEYIGKIYMETKGRPRYIVEKYLHRQKRGKNRMRVSVCIPAYNG